MQISFRETSVLGFEKKFPLTSKLLKDTVEDRFANSFMESGSKPETYKFELSVGYYKEDEEDRPVGEPVTAEDGRKFYETRTVLIVGHYLGQFHERRTALFGLNLVDPRSEFPVEETKGIETLFNEIKSYPLDSIPGEI